MLFTQLPDLFSAKLVDALWPFGHVVIFATWVSLIFFYRPQLLATSFQIQFALVSILALFVGGAIELIQPFFGRSAELGDIYFNWLGCFAALIFLTKAKLSHRLLAGLRIICLSLLTIHAIPAFHTVKDELQAIWNFPVLAEFNSANELQRWKSDQPLSRVKESELLGDEKANNSLMKVTLSTRSYTGAALRYFPGDWREYDQVKVELFNPNPKTLKLNCIIIDKQYNKSRPNAEDRFDQWIHVPPGWSSHYISLEEVRNAPIDRDMDLAQISGFDLYAYKLKAPLNIYINQVKLLRDNK